jgi:choline kinase
MMPVVPAASNRPGRGRRSRTAVVDQAVILAAGNGDRFADPHGRSKLVYPVRGRALILRTLESVVAAGISRLHVILGYDADRVRAIVNTFHSTGVRIDFAYNADWQLENGVSALQAERLCGNRRFALVMGDHLCPPSLLRTAGRFPIGARESVLAVDTRPLEASREDEVTRVRLDGDFVVQIGKRITPFDAVDTGVFVFSPELFGALRDAQRDGATTLSAGVQQLARRRLVRAAAIANAAWCDVDTQEDLAVAEALAERISSQPAQE